MENRAINLPDISLFKFTSCRCPTHFQLYCPVKLSSPYHRSRWHRGGVKVSSTLYLTSALYRGRWSTLRPGRFTSGKDPVPIVQEAGLTPGPFLTVAENLVPHLDSIPGPSSPWRGAILTELSRPLIWSYTHTYTVPPSFGVHESL